MSFQQAQKAASELGSGLAALGQQPHSNIAIFCETRAEWMVAAQACFLHSFPGQTQTLTLKQEFMCCEYIFTPATHSQFIYSVGGRLGLEGICSQN
jgi:long-chain acyl-CoA synthetase